jgi:multimeric flavodoxin WrbA
MQVLGIVGSMRKDRHTGTLVARVLSDMVRLDPGVVADVVYLAGKTIHPCRVVCSDYCSGHPYQCCLADDAAEILLRLAQADAVVIGAPLYFRGPPARFQAFAERLVSIFFFRETREGIDEASPLAGKPCGLVAVAEYSNPHHILEYLHDFCTVLKMRPVTLDRFPYLGVAGQGDVEHDTIFKPLERSADLAAALVGEVRRRPQKGKQTDASKS